MTTDKSPLPFPADGRLAAVDYGTVRIGIAVCDPDRILASPLEVFHRKEIKDLADTFRNLASLEKILGWVVGLPVHLDGRESEKSKEARDFAAWLARETELPVRLFDERFTTSAADEKMRPSKFTRKKRKVRVDAVAAQVLLETFLEAAASHSELPGYDLGEPPKGDLPLDS